MKNAMSTGEKEPAQWEEVTDETQEELKRISIFMEAKLPKLDALLLFSGEYRTGGLILRRGNLPIGHLRYSIGTLQSGHKGMLINYAHINKGDRSAGVTFKLIRTLRTIGEREDVKRIGWAPIERNMKTISEKILHRKPGFHAFMPLENLDVSMLTGRLENESE